MANIDHTNQTKDEKTISIIGKNIHKFRKQKGYTQSELAERLGVKNTTVSNWETGDNNPPADLLGNICDVLGISASELLGLKLSNDEFNSEERRIIKKYRENKAMQHAVKVLLGIDRV